MKPPDLLTHRRVRPPAGPRHRRSVRARPGPRVASPRDTRLCATSGTLPRPLSRHAARLPAAPRPREGRAAARAPFPAGPLQNPVPRGGGYSRGHGRENSRGRAAGGYSRGHGRENSRGRAAGGYSRGHGRENSRRGGGAPEPSPAGPLQNPEPRAPAGLGPRGRVGARARGRVRRACRSARPRCSRRGPGPPPVLSQPLVTASRHARAAEPRLRDCVLQLSRSSSMCS